jgi:predicted RNase H-like nuclease (RuvC/YqgF family)
MGAGNKKSKLEVARSRMHSANKRENEWRRLFEEMRENRDVLHYENMELKAKILVLENKLGMTI